MTQFQALQSWVKAWPKWGKIAFLAFLALVLIRLSPRFGWVLAAVIVLWGVLTLGGSKAS